MPYNEADTRAKLIDPAIHRCGWTEDLIRREETAIDKAEAKFKELTRESKDLAAKAKDIEDAVYDLKAVNPNRKPVVDTRTPEELMDIIEEKGREVAHALAVLREGMRV